VLVANGAEPASDPGLEAVRATGVATSTNLVDGMRGVSAPIFLAGGGVAALAVIGPAPIVPDEPDSVVARSVRRTADEITYLIGGRDLVPAIVPDPEPEP
jgi:DNA-binding IclR family transcriptional regulator